MSRWSQTCHKLHKELRLTASMRRKRSQWVNWSSFCVFLSLVAHSFSRIVQSASYAYAGWLTARLKWRRQSEKDFLHWDVFTGICTRELLNKSVTRPSCFYILVQLLTVKNDQGKLSFKYENGYQGIKWKTYSLFLFHWVQYNYQTEA